MLVRAFLSSGGIVAWSPAESFCFVAMSILSPFKNTLIGVLLQNLHFGGVLRTAIHIALFHS